MPVILEALDHQRRSVHERFLSHHPYDALALYCIGRVSHLLPLFVGRLTFYAARTGAVHVHSILSLTDQNILFYTPIK